MAGNEVVEGPVKTDAGRRVVPMVDRLAAALIAWREVQRLEAAEHGEAYEGTGYVLTYENGTPLLPQYATRSFQKLPVEAGLPEGAFLAQRHEALTPMIEGGADLLSVSRIAGHASVAITVDIYGHVFDSGKMRAAEGGAAARAALQRDRLMPRCVRGFSRIAHTLHADKFSAPEASTLTELNSHDVRHFVLSG